MFVDEARIYVKAGDGGKGCVAFRREKFVPKGGPSGGDGGDGGSVVLVSTPNENTLLRYRYNREFRGDRGRHGEGSNCHGASGEDLVLEVPVGTQVYDEQSGELLHDFSAGAQRFIAAQGGHGGRGNARFAKSWHQAPREFEDGELGGERHLRLELKLLADVGLVGFPNAGKSTLISRISAARPKIADYPFTTLEPHLGVVSVDRDRKGTRRTFVVADLPGLIAGAHEGVGLGIRFLRHIERTRLLAQLVDVSDAAERDPVEDFEIIREELRASNESLAAKPFLVVATKLDAAIDRVNFHKLREYCRQQDFPLFAISAATGEGIPQLVRGMADAISKLAPPDMVHSEEDHGFIHDEAARDDMGGAEEARDFNSSAGGSASVEEV